MYSRWYLKLMFSCIYWTPPPPNNNRSSNTLSSHWHCDACGTKWKPFKCLELCTSPKHHAHSKNKTVFSCIYITLLWGRNLHLHISSYVLLNPINECPATVRHTIVSHKIRSKSVLCACRLTIFPISKCFKNNNKKGNINSPQKVRKSNFGPLYLPYNKTKWYCIYYIPFSSLICPLYNEVHYVMIRHSWNEKRC